MDTDSPDAVSGAEQTDDLLTRAATEALAAGMSWAQLGVPPPAAHCAVTDQDWQEGIIAHTNARAARLNDQTWTRRPSGETP